MENAKIQETVVRVMFTNFGKVEWSNFGAKNQKTLLASLAM